jgi:hypothetical protein
VRLAIDIQTLPPPVTIALGPPAKRSEWRVRAWRVCSSYTDSGEGWRMGLVLTNDGWRIPKELWARMEPLLPPRPAHPLGCHNPRVPDRDAMNAILFVLRTGCQWNALDATGICSCSSAYRRFREWTEAGVFLESWKEGLVEYDGIKGVDWNG